MPKSKHSEAAILAALQQLDAGRKAADVAREAGVSLDVYTTSNMALKRDAVQKLDAIMLSARLRPNSKSAG